MKITIEASPETLLRVGVLIATQTKAELTAAQILLEKEDLRRVKFQSADNLAVVKQITAQASRGDRPKRRIRG